MLDILGTFVELGFAERDGLTDDITAVEFHRLADLDSSVTDKEGLFGGRSCALVKSLGVHIPDEAEGADFSNENKDQEEEGPAFLHVEGGDDARDGGEEAEDGEVVEAARTFGLEAVAVVGVAVLVEGHGDFGVFAVELTIHVDGRDESESAVDEEQDGTDEGALAPSVSTLLSFGERDRKSVV